MGRLVGTVVGLLLLSTSAQVQEKGALSKGGENDTGPYDVVETFPAPLDRPGYVYGSQGGVFAETPNKIFIVQRGELPMPENPPTLYIGGPATKGIYGPPMGAISPGNKPDVVNTIRIVDGTGKQIASWKQYDELFSGAPNFLGPHKVKISPYDPEKHVWVIDNFTNQVIEFTNDGSRIVLKLGEKGVRGTDPKHFGGVTDIAFLPDGTFFISDG